VDIARKNARYITIDAHKYRVKPASKSVIEAINEIREPMEQLGDETIDPVDMAHSMIDAFAFRLEAENGAPDPKELLLDLFEKRELIGLEELEQLGEDIAGKPVVNPPR
jgi:hypothetical protein